MTRNEITMLLGMLAEYDNGLEMVTIDGLDIIYNRYMNGGEWEVFDHDGDHIEYDAYDNIDELVDRLI